MARVTTPLSDKSIKSFKAEAKDYKKFDGGGLFLLVTKNGGKRWRLKYQFEGKEKIFALGTYPSISLANARSMREELKAKIANGINPADERKKKKQQLKKEAEKIKNTFENVAIESLAKRNTLSEDYKKRLENSFKLDTYPFIGQIPIEDITKKDIMTILERVEERGAIESAHRLLTQINRVFKFAYLKDYIQVNPCDKIDRKEELQSHTSTKYATLTDEKQIQSLLKLTEEYTGDFTTRMALTLAPYVALRPSNIREAEWSEIDFENRQWIIPSSKMKIKGQGDFIVPLTDRTIEIFQEVQVFSGDKKYIFHSYRNQNAPMSDNTLNQGLKRMGFTNKEIVPHGFRAMFSTIANDNLSSHGIHPKVIDIQLAHSAKSKIEASYNRADYLEDRIKLMQWWSDYLDAIKIKDF